MVVQNVGAKEKADYNGCAFVKDLDPLYLCNGCPAL